MSIFTKAQRLNIIERCIKSKEGLIKLSAALESSIHRMIDFTSLTRRILYEDILPKGSHVSTTYPDTKCTVVAGSRRPRRLSTRRRVIVPDFIIETTVSIPLRSFAKTLANNNFPMKIAKRLTDTETRYLVDCLRVACTEVSKQRIASNSLRTALPKAIKMIEDHDLRVANIIAHEDTVIKISKVFKDGFDKNTRKEILAIGYYGMLWGSHVFATNIVPRNKIYICAESEFVGVLPVVTNAFCDIACAKKNKQPCLSVYTQEEIGMAICNPKAACELTLRY